MRGDVAGLGELHIALRLQNFFPGPAHSGIGPSQFGLQFGNLWNGQRLAFFYVVADINVNRLEVSGDFRVYINVLERFERSSNR